MRTTNLLVAALLATLIASPLVAAADNSTNPPSQIDVNVHGGDGPNENSGFLGLNTTVVVVLIVLAVLVIALIVALASRPGYP